MFGLGSRKSVAADRFADPVLGGSTDSRRSAGRHGEWMGARAPFLRVFVDDALTDDAGIRHGLDAVSRGQSYELFDVLPHDSRGYVGQGRAVGRTNDSVCHATEPAAFTVALMLPNESLNEALNVLLDPILEANARGGEHTLVICVAPRQLAALGRWLTQRADAGRLAHVRLLVAGSAHAAIGQLSQRLDHAPGSNVIRMPASTEIDDPPMRNFFVFSPQLFALRARIDAYARNGIERLYLLGGPGSGKTSFAYYYFLTRSAARSTGRFVSVNLAAENTGDKAAIKSLLCGHVGGAFPGAAPRVGAFGIAREGVCFIDEAHGISGPVMEVLMEAFDNGQYLPFGASAKQPLQCAIVFATNRSWDFLQSSVNIDEFTRLGAPALSVPELHEREEDLIAVAATSLARLGARCSTWTPPEGLSEDAWQTVRRCRWHGNVRALVRVIESAFVACGVESAESQITDAVLSAAAIDNAIVQWEPAQHHSHALYATG